MKDERKLAAIKRNLDMIESSLFTIATVFNDMSCQIKATIKIMNGILERMQSDEKQV